MEKSYFLDDNLPPDGMSVHPRRTAVKICLGYTVAGWLWIILSDRAVSFLTQNTETIVAISSIKGSFFIFVTAAILYFLVYGQLRQVEKAQFFYIQSVRELELAHESLSSSEEKLRQQLDELTVKAKIIEEKDREMWSLFENMRDAFAVSEIILDDQGSPIDYRFLIANPAYETLMRVTHKELIGHRALEIFPDLERDFIEICGKVALTGNTRKMSIFSKALNKYLSISIYSPRKEQFAILASDVTDEIMHAQTVERLAYYDRLTGLPNRVKLTEVLSRAFDSGTGVPPYGTLLYIDMDDLKLVNDSYGHSYGDAMIITAAMYLVSMAEPDSIVARVGGDEFIVLIPGMTDSEKVEQMASEFVETLSRDYEVRDLRFHASASIGIVMYPRDGGSAEEILRNADTALYEAKRSGKRCWRFFRQSMQETAYGNMQLINGLQKALINQELEVYFQPQMSLKSGKLTGFEALLRWNSPKHGDISPALFIPLIEKSLLIETIGAWTMKEACKFARALADNGYPEIRVAVNVSPRQLKAADFISIVRDSCKESDLMPANLEIEITENVFIESMEECVHKLDELRAMGVHLSLDDFGTGYSSLTYLRSLPVQTLKIDKSFIDLLSKDKAVSELIASIVDMAHVLGLVVVAEGVETQEQVERLIQYGCDTIQGYIVSRAVPAAVALNYLSTGIGSVRLNLLDVSVI